MPWIRIVFVTVQVVHVEGAAVIKLWLLRPRFRNQVKPSATRVKEIYVIVLRLFGRRIVIALPPPAEINKREREKTSHLNLSETQMRFIESLLVCKSFMLYKHN